MIWTLDERPYTHTHTLIDNEWNALLSHIIMMVILLFAFHVCTFLVCFTLKSVHFVLFSFSMLSKLLLRAFVRHFKRERKSTTPGERIFAHFCTHNAYTFVFVSVDYSRFWLLNIKKNKFYFPEITLKISKIHLI